MDKTTEKKGAVKAGVKKFLNWTLVVVILALLAFGAVRYYYPYGEGVKAGQLNYVVYKGIIFKTYEGKLIQSGVWSNKPGGVQSNEFEFSIEDKTIAEQLMLAGGKTVELHYKEYFAALPWRGYSRYVVDKIVKINDESPDSSDSSVIRP
ncbi:hypothetical protein [Parabacteroides sp. Marseille-P3160]|uniref:hypothetical protein n=1 Tax=Parabacteroides sp. Marseille-P3160 TaxID=1917887 RepID=UPI0009B993B0|nr:hypothetical protein [Parabacteroides sp. Marseille-P3160]